MAKKIPELAEVVWNGMKFPGYVVSKDGEVYSSKMVDTFGKDVVWYKGSWYYKKSKKCVPSSYGYYIVQLSSESKVKFKACVHVVVANTFLGDNEDGLYVCHNDGNPKNNSLENLRYDNSKGNQNDRERHGTHQWGEKNARAKLTNAQIVELKELKKSGIKNCDLAKKYGINERHVRRILSGDRRSKFNEVKNV